MKYQKLSVTFNSISVFVLLTVASQFTFAHSSVQCVKLFNEINLPESSGAMTVVNSVFENSVAQIESQKLANTGVILVKDAQFLWGNHSEKNHYIGVEKTYTTDKYIYLASGAGGLNVVDKVTGERIFNKTFHESSTFGHSIGADVVGVYVDSKYIYVAARGASVIVLDVHTFEEVSTLESPGYIGHIDGSIQGELDIKKLVKTRPAAIDVRVQDGLAYIVGARAILNNSSSDAPLVNVVDIETGMIKKVITLPESFWKNYSTNLDGLEVSGDSLYLSYSFVGIIEYNMRTKEFHPFERGYATTPSGLVIRVPETPQSIRVTSDRLFVTDHYLGIATFDRKTRRFKGYIQTSGPNQLWATGVDLDPVTGALYVSNAGAGGMAILTPNALSYGVGKIEDQFAKVPSQKTQIIEAEKPKNLLQKIFNKLVR